MIVPPAMTQPKTVQSGLPAPVLSSRPTGISAPISRPESPSQNLPFAEIFKKAAANLVQLLLNPFIISIFSTKITPEKREKTTQNRLFLLLFGLFQPFLAPFSTHFLAPPFLRVLPPFFASPLGTCLHTVQPAGQRQESLRPRVDPRRARPLKPRQSAPVLPPLNRVSRGSARIFVASSLFFIHLQPTQVCR